jgi:hypothetical protein
MTQEKFSYGNLLNSMSLEVSTKLLAAGYLIYWRQPDSVQTGAGWYNQYSTTFATHLADGTFASAVTGAKGLITLTDQIPALPRYIVRPISDGTVPGEHEVMVPTLSIEVAPPQVASRYELGSDLKYRNRHLVIDGYLRTKAEQTAMEDMLSVLFDQDQHFDILDHDAGDLAVIGQVRVNHPTVVSGTIQPQGVESVTYQVVMNTFLEYVA